MVHAHAVMQPLEGQTIPDGSPRVNEGETLSTLIQLAIDNDKPVVVEDGGVDVGVISRQDLLRTVIEGTEVS